jgi:DHA1 family purine ribonucleoside efflux pump-like MFS transporter
MNDCTCIDDVATAPAAARPTLSPAADAARAGTSNWAGIASLTLGVFGLVTAEFLPASLLTAMAQDLGVSDGAAGQAVTATAAVGAVAALTLPILTRNLDRKKVILALTTLLLLSNVLAATAGSLAVLIAARALLGVGLGGFWSMAAALAMRLVPEHLFARAMSAILTGVSVATVCAAPVGAYMGDLWGWRSAFVAAGVVSIVTLVAQAFTIPSLPPKDNPNVKVLFELLGRTNVRVALIAVLLVVSGHFAGFTYIRPFMEHITHLSVSAISATLLAYGIAGFFGNFAGAFLAERSERLAIVAGAVLIALLAATLWTAGASVPVAIAAIALWGFAFAVFPIGFQTWIVRAAPDQAEGAGGLMVAAFQIAIAGGAIGGGILVDRIGALGGPVFATIALALGALLVIRFGPRRA